MTAGKPAVNAASLDNIHVFRGARGYLRENLYRSEGRMAITGKKILSSLILILVLFFVMFIGYVWVALHWSFSKGERVGYIQKISQKGWIVKTWEGELQMLPVPGAVPDKFVFSVRDDSVAQKINGAAGKKVSVNYEQHKGVPTTLFGETEYFVTNVKVLE